MLTLAAIVVLGIAGQWLAWRLRLPSILMLLLFGFIAGPLTGVLDPDHLLGDLLFPVVSLAVALVLFEGGLSLKFSELRGMGSALRNLLTVGALVTWGLSTAAAHWLGGLSLQLATLLGAILVVTGPTVIGPLLRHVRPSGRVGPLLKWEGIVIDPIGAVMAVLVFEVIQASQIGEAATLVAWSLAKTIVAGGLAGLVGAGLLVWLIRRYWVPDYLQSSTALMLALASFAISNEIQHESGLLAVTVMGVALANQRSVTIYHIVEFKENLRVLLIASLFIVLAARLQIADLAQIGLGSLAFLAALIVIVRPVSVALSTLGSKLRRPERIFLAWMAPRGIVAAAVASIFALRLTEAGFEEARLLVPFTFVVVIGTVAIYGLTAAPLARWLGVSQGNPQGVLIAGAHGWARAIARALQDSGIPAVLLDTNPQNVAEARASGLRAYSESVVAEDIRDEIDLSGIGRLLALTSNDEVNSLAALHFAEVFGRAEVYQLVGRQRPRGSQNDVPARLRGRRLFESGATYDSLARLFARGASVSAIRLTKELKYAAVRQQLGEAAVPMFVVTEGKRLIIGTVDDPLAPQSGQTLISLAVRDGAEPNAAAAAA